MDTSAWVEFDRATGTSVDVRLSDLIENDAAIAVTEPVIMEVTAGARDAARERDLRRLLGRFNLMRFDAAVDLDAASKIYLTCRRDGVTPRGMIDCMIASVAYRNNASLLALDSDLERVSQIIGIPMEVH